MRALNYKKRKASLPRPFCGGGFTQDFPPAPIDRPRETARRFPGVATDPPKVPPIQVDLYPHGTRDVIDGRD